MEKVETKYHDFTTGMLENKEDETSEVLFRLSASCIVISSTKYYPWQSSILDKIQVYTKCVSGIYARFAYDGTLKINLQVKRDVLFFKMDSACFGTFGISLSYFLKYFFI